MAQLQAPQGVHAEYASHTCPKLITAKPKASSLTLLDITFSNLDADANAEDAIIFRTKGNAMSLYACELVGGGDGEADQMVLGTFKRKAWSWRNRFVFTSGRKEKPEDKGSPVVVESTSGRWKNWQAIDVLYTDTLSGRSELGEQRDEVLARVGRKRRAFLKAHWVSAETTIGMLCEQRDLLTGLLRPSTEATIRTL